MSKGATGWNYTTVDHYNIKEVIMNWYEYLMYASAPHSDMDALFAWLSE